MKFVCLSYLGPITWDTMSDEDRKASMAEFFAFDAELRKKGHLIGGQGLQNAKSAATLRYKSGKVVVTDGPYAETKEQLAGYFILEADDMNQAVELMSRNPAVRGGAIEIRPVADSSAREAERER